jgi:co-chaperonin GroES (HSP10)
MKAMVKCTSALQAMIVGEKDWRLDEEVLSSFPDVNPKVVPLGARVLCQLVTPRTTTASGLILVEETKETERWNNQVARVIAVGPLAFCNRETAEPWKEGTWAEPGDFVIIPRWGGQRRTVRTKDGEDPIYFVTVNDHEIIEKVFGNPLALETYIL